jgi:NitT/TauT family transport system substrate-binding protein
MSQMQTRRRLLTMMALAGAGSAIRLRPALAAEGALETNTVRIANTSGICPAPQWIAEGLLRAEGFADVRYVQLVPGSNAPDGIARNEVDFGLNFASVLVAALDRGAEMTVLGGVHVGCFELFANEGIRSLTELKGKKVGITWLGSPGHLFLAAMAASVGIDPGKDIHWVTSNQPVAMELFTSGKVDVYMGFPLEAQELRAQHIGHVIVNSSVDRPWSQYFCCMLAGNREFVRKHPVATKAVLRAILKAADICATEPARAARILVDGGFTPRYDYALQTLNDVPYDKWREYDHEDTLRFYALRLHEVGIIKASPQKIIADGTDWRFLEEVRRELKA